MIRFIPYALSGLLVAFAWYIWSDREALKLQNVNLESELAVKDRILEQAKEARAVEKARAERFRKEKEKLDASIAALYSDEIPDADLDPRIVDIINGVRGASD